jgi:alpha-beta hydrolase superfamily lysophospholipase
MHLSTKDPIIKETSFFSDGFKLKGILHVPAAYRSVVVIGCHGLHSDKNSPKQIALAKRCNQLGIAFFRFDHRGCGESQGQFEQVTSLDGRCKDLISAIEFIRHSIGPVNGIGLFGSSLGGAVSLRVASENEILTLVTVAAPIHSRMLKQDRAQAQAAEARVAQGGAASLHFDIRPKLTSIRNILIFHGEADQVVPLAHAEEIFRRAKDPKKLIIQPKGDHRMSQTSHQQEFIQEASLWFHSRLIENSF